MTQDTTQPDTVAQGPLQSARMALYGPVDFTGNGQCVCGHRQGNHGGDGCWDVANDRPFHCDCTEFRLAPTPTRSHSDLDIERHNAMRDLMAEYRDKPSIELNYAIKRLEDQHREYITTDNPYTAELLREYMDNNATTTLTIQHALIELTHAQHELQGMTGDIYDLLLLDRRLSVIRQLLEGVTQ